METAQARAKVSKVAQWLIGKGRPDDAVNLLVAWAANGPNDASGQALLAEALSLDPSAAVAQQAFERMEGILCWPYRSAYVTINGSKAYCFWRLGRQTHHQESCVAHALRRSSD